jgi:hypothetical protein
MTAAINLYDVSELPRSNEERGIGLITSIYTNQYYNHRKGTRTQSINIKITNIAWQWGMMKLGALLEWGPLYGDEDAGGFAAEPVGAEAPALPFQLGATLPPVGFPWAPDWLGGTVSLDGLTFQPIVADEYGSLDVPGSPESLEPPPLDPFQPPWSPPCPPSVGVTVSDDFWPVEDPSEVAPIGDEIVRVKVAPGSEPVYVVGEVSIVGSVVDTIDATVLNPPDTFDSDNWVPDPVVRPREEVETGVWIEVGGSEVSTEESVDAVEAEAGILGVADVEVGLTILLSEDIEVEEMLFAILVDWELLSVPRDVVEEVDAALVKVLVLEDVKVEVLVEVGETVPDVSVVELKVDAIELRLCDMPLSVETEVDVADCELIEFEVTAVLLTIANANKPPPFQPPLQIPFPMLKVTSNMPPAFDPVNDTPLRGFPLTRS